MISVHVSLEYEDLSTYPRFLYARWFAIFIYYKGLGLVILFLIVYNVKVKGKVISMQSFDETIMFNLDDLNKKTVRETLEIVYNALEEKGYDPINQIVGYLMSGDPAYIPRHNDARNLIRRHERDEILESVIRYYITYND